MRRALGLVRRRLIGVVPVFCLVVLGAFLLLEAAPGDAVDAYLAGIGGGDAAQRAALRTEWGLDQGPLPRLWAYVMALLRLDLGWSTAFARPVLSVVLERLPNTLLLIRQLSTQMQKLIRIPMLMSRRRQKRMCKR